MNYPMFFLSLVSILVIVALIVTFFTSRGSKYRDDWYTVLVLLGICALIGAPVIYQFKSCDGSVIQYEIIRDEKGQIVDLKPFTSGFHSPLPIRSRFVKLQKSLSFSGVVDLSYAEAADTKGVTPVARIRYWVVSPDLAKSYVKSQGKIYSFPMALGSIKRRFEQSFIDKYLAPTEDFSYRNVTPKEVEEFFWRRAEEWNNSEASFGLEIRKPDLKLGPIWN